MKRLISAAAACTVALMIGACSNQPVQRVNVPGPEDQQAYRPLPMPKPLPPDGYIPGPPPAQMPPGQPGGGGAGMPMPGMLPPLPGPGVSAPPSIPNEGAFVQAYTSRRSPRIMVFVNRTIQGDPLPKDGLEEVLRVEEHQGATGPVNVNSNHTVTGNNQSSSAGYTGASNSNSNINNNRSTSFVTGGPADYTHSTSVKRAGDKTDWIGASSDDYQMIEAALVSYFNNSGQVRIKDADAVRGKLDREQVLRIENGDPAAQRLLATEFQQDVLVRVTAVPTRQSSNGPGVRLIAKAVSTTSGDLLATSYVDMPPQLSKSAINYYAGYLTSDLMGQMAKKWSMPQSIELRVYKAATVDDALKISKWLKATQGVQQVLNEGSTGGSSTAYAAFSVGYQGAPEDLYDSLKDAAGASQGIKAVDLQNNTISLEVTGPMTLTTTRRSETHTITETHTTEDRRVEPINPAPPTPQQ